MSIARVLLDNETEDKLLKALDSYVKDKTVVTIAHRQSSIENADRVIDLGKV